MAYIAPTTRSTGALIPATVWNQDVVANPIALYAGAMSIASQATNDFVYASSATQLARLAAITGVPRFNGSAWVMSALTQYELLKANSGTDTNASATNVDTFAITGLTAKDTLVAWICWEAVTQQTASVSLYHNTDGVTIAQPATGAVVAGREFISQAYIRQLQSAATELMGNADGRDDSGAAPGSSTRATVTTAWTAAWTIALRHGGVTAGGTARWSWSLYRLLGQ